jgi:putative RecB family exonuclease
MIATVTPPESPFTTGLTPWAQCLPDHISPTAAKAYLACSLKFYFERVACIRKATPAALHLGKAVHAALQAFHLARWRGGDDSPAAIANAYELAFLRLDGLRVVAAYLDSPEAMKEKPRAVKVLLTENTAGLSVPLTGAMMSKATSRRSISNPLPPGPIPPAPSSTTRSSSSAINC